MSAWGRTNPRLRSALARIPQTAVAVRTTRLATGRHLRVLGFHGVTDLQLFTALVDTVRRHYHPVTARRRGPIDHV